MSIQLKASQEHIDQVVTKLLENMTSEDALQTVSNWLKSDIFDMTDVRYELLSRRANGTPIDAKKYFKLIESMRYTIAMMEQASEVFE